MARPQSTAQLGYFPTPDVVIDRLRDFLLLPDDLHALDPCCGEGRALINLTSDCKRPDLYGVELAANRAAVAANALSGDVLACGIEDARISNNRFGLVFLNPPYDTTSQGRLEEMFLERATKYLAHNGVLVLIISVRNYSANIKRHLTTHYDDFRHWKFPPDYYPQFSQTVLVATKRPVPISPDLETIENTLGDIRPYSMEYMPESFELRSYRAPPGWEPDVFYAGILSKEAYSELVTRSPLKRKPRDFGMFGGNRPPLPLGKGHLALVLASGLVNGVCGTGDNTHVAKGTVGRTTISEEERGETGDGNPVLIKRRIETFKITIRALRPNGTIADISSVANLGDADNAT